MSEALSESRRPPWFKRLFLLALVALCVWIGVHGATRGWELQRRLICAANLKAVASGRFSPDRTICPSSGLSSSNYVLVPRTAGAALDDRSVIAYEPKSNHGGEGGIVVFADGHASFVPVPTYDELLAETAVAAPPGPERP